MARQSSKEWADRVSQWQRSGLSGPQFASREGIDVRQLRWWKWHLRKRAAASTEIVPVRIVERKTAGSVPLVSAAAVLEVVSPSGWRIRVPANCDRGTLSRVVTVLSECAC